MTVEPNYSSLPHHLHPHGYPVPPWATQPPPLVERSDELDLGQVVRIAVRRKGIIAGVTIAVTAAIWGWTLTRTAIYQGSFRVLVESVEEGDRSQQLLQDAQAPSSTFDYDTQIEVLRSPALLEPIVEELRTTYPDIHYGGLTGNLSIARLRETKVLEVSFRDPDPEKIKAVLQEVSDQYLRYSFQQRQSSLQQGVLFVEGQLPELQERVDNLQARLERFRQQYSLVDPESRGQNLSDFISTIERQRQETQTQLTETRSLFDTLQGQLGYGPDQAIATSALSESSHYQTILSQLQEVERQIAEESARFRPDSPNIQVLNDKRDSLLPLLDQEADRLLAGRGRRGVSDRLTDTSLDLNRQLLATANQVEVLEARSTALAQVEERLKQEFSLVPALAREYTALQRELTIATASLNRFLETRETLQIEAAQKSIPWELLAQPGVSGLPISPNVPRNLMLGAIAGLLLGAAAALVAEKLDTAIHSPEELKAITRLPILGVIPFIKDWQSSASPQDAPPAIPALEADSPGATVAATSLAYQSSPVVESFRSLFTNIRFLSSDTPIRSLVISSASPAEGKSTNALHLAKAAAAMGQRVLLVDADLRRPQVHLRLNLPNLRGLTSLLTSQISLHHAIQSTLPSMQGPLADPNLTVLTAGPTPPDPVKLLSSRRMQTFMSQVQSQYDLVIYDMPPLIGFADSTLLATHTDGLVVVVGLGKTSRAALSQALETLKISPVVVMGIIANGLRSHASSSYDYDHYHRYYRRPDTQANQYGSVAAIAPPFGPDRGDRGQFRLPSLATLSPRMRLLMFGGIGLTVLLGLLGWAAYRRIAELPPEGLTSERPSSGATIPVSTGASSLPADPFSEAVRLAESAVEEGMVAQTSEDWYDLSVRWEQAADLMSVVPASDSRSATAKERALLYRLNSEYTRRRSEEASVVP